MITEPWQKLEGPSPLPLSLYLTLCVCTLCVEGDSFIFSPTLNSLIFDFLKFFCLFVCLCAIAVKTCTAYLATLLG